MTSGLVHTFDVIVIGAGVEGSATAYYLTSRHTKNVLLLEQFEANQLKGSSQGGSRCFHTDYSSQTYIKLIKDSLPLWKELEDKSGRKLLWYCGALAFSKNSDPGFSSRLESLTDNNIPYKVLSENDIKHRYPEQLKASSDHQCIYFPCGGAINASLAIKTMQELFVRDGGDFRDCHRVTGLLPGSVVTVETDKGIFKTKKIVLATGAWTNKLLHSTRLHLELQMKIFRTEVFYFKVSKPEHFTVEEFPIFFESIFDISNPGAAYGIPILENSNMIKVCQFYGSGDVEIGVEEITQLKANRKSLCAVQRFIKDHFKGVDHYPAIYETCVYANAPDFCPYIDSHPDYSNIIIASGFSHGFKMSPVFGKMIAEMTMELLPSYDLSSFKIDRKQQS